MPLMPRDDRGQDIAEYALIVAVIVILTIGAIRYLWSAINKMGHVVFPAVQSHPPMTPLRYAAIVLLFLATAQLPNPSSASPPPPPRAKPPSKPNSNPSPLPTKNAASTASSPRNPTSPDRSATTNSPNTFATNGKSRASKTSSSAATTSTAPTQSPPRWK